MMIARLFAKLLVLPILLIVKMAGALLYGIAWAAAHVAGPLLFCFGGFAVCSVFQHDWTDAAILAAVCGLIYGAFIISGFLLGLMQNIGSGLSEFLLS